MRFAYFWAVISKLFYFLLPLCLAPIVASSQVQDSSFYELFDHKVVLYGDLSFNTAPFEISGNFTNGTNKLYYRNNIQPSLGIGCNYRKIGLRLSYTLPINLLSKDDFGETKVLDIGLKVLIKQLYLDLDIRNYKGYAIQDAYHWNSAYDESRPNQYRSDINSRCIAINSRYFINKDFNYKAVMGKAGHYLKRAHTFYFRGSLSYFGINNNSNRPIIPQIISDTADIYSATQIGSLDLTIIPSYAYVTRVKNWQFAGFAGLGAALQSKVFTTTDIQRGYLGGALRLELLFTVGYTKENYFIFANYEFDHKSINILDIDYQQSYHNFTISAGYRFKTKRKKM